MTSGPSVSLSPGGATTGSCVQHQRPGPGEGCQSKPRAAGQNPAVWTAWNFGCWLAGHSRATREWTLLSEGATAEGGGPETCWPSCLMLRTCPRPVCVTNSQRQDHGTACRLPGASCGSCSLHPGQAHSTLRVTLLFPTTPINKYVSQPLPSQSLQSGLCAKGTKENGGCISFFPFSFPLYFAQCQAPS